MLSTFRTTIRAAYFAATLADIFLDYFFSSPRTPLTRAQWMQRGSRRVLRVLRVRYTAIGNFPKNGILVSNHLSYVDILVLSALSPCVFVSKSDVRNWPVFGWLATLSGTVYVERDRTQTAVIANRQIEEKISGGLPLVFFPEGTSTDGSKILPFKSSIFSAACNTGQPIHCAYLHYQLSPQNAPNVSVSQNVCYWGEMSIVPHLLGVLALKGVHAEVNFADAAIFERDRKLAARCAEATVRALAEFSAGPATPQAASA